MSASADYREFLDLPRLTSLTGRCGFCERTVDNHDPEHRVTCIIRGGRGVECVRRGDIQLWEAQPLGHRL